MGREFVLQIPRLYKNLDELWVVARRTDRLKSLQEQVKIPVRIFDGDMQRNYIFEKIQKELERRQADVRMLVNAAGYGKIGRVASIDLNEQCGMVDLNCTALTKMTGICLPYLSKGSRIINLASAAAFCAQPGFCVYAASKAYVLRFSQGLAAELKKQGILVTAVCPGPVHTEFFDRAGTLAVSKKEAFCAEPEAGDSDLTVAKYVEKVAKENGANMTVKKFVRFETGEGLEKKNEDFAAEVAAQMNA